LRSTGSPNRRMGWMATGLLALGVCEALGECEDSLGIARSEGRRVHLDVDAQPVGEAQLFDG